MEVVCATISSLSSFVGAFLYSLLLFDYYPLFILNLLNAGPAGDLITKDALSFIFILSSFISIKFLTLSGVF
jgi:hypothetical protein